MWANYHMHNHYCDGEGALSDYAKEGASKEVISMGFSSHAPLPFPRSWCMDKGDQEAYLREAESVRSTYRSLHVYTGMEVDYVPGMTGPRDFEDGLDYTIGSVHFVDQFPDGSFWEIDGSHDHFLSGLSAIFGGDMRAAVERYFELTREMLEKSPPDILGHFDKIKIQNKAGSFFRESDAWYRAEITRTLDVAASAGVIVEVNTRGQYQGKSQTTYPSPWILEMILQRGMPVTISSDAHKPEDIISLFPECAAMLLDIGFENISVLLNRHWQQVKLTPHGISI